MGRASFIIMLTLSIVDEFLGEKEEVSQVQTNNLGVNCGMCLHIP